MTHPRVCHAGLVLAACTTPPSPTALSPINCNQNRTEFRCQPAYQARSVPAHRGFTWQPDPTFLLEGHTVPSLVHLRDGTHLLISTERRSRGQLAVHHSTDGRTWTRRGTLPTHTLPAACGRTFLDATAQYLPDGGIRLLVEGWMTATGQAHPGATGPAQPGDDPGIRLCALRTMDGHSWTPETTGPLLPTDGSLWPSVPSVFQHDTASDLTLFFADTFPGRDSVRAAAPGPTGAFVPRGPETLLPERHVDPEPVHIAGTRSVRLYHTYDALTGELGSAESHDDGATFGNVRLLSGLSGQVCYTPPEQPSPPDLCRLDPAFMALPDGTLHLYYSQFQTTADGTEVIGIGRAIATD